MGIQGGGRPAVQSTREPRLTVGCRWIQALETGGVLVWKIGGSRRTTAAMPTYLYCGVIAVMLLMHIKYEGYGLWPVPESHGGGCTPPLERTRSITKEEALAPACKASGAGALTGRSSPSSAEHTRAVILHYRTYGRYHISTPPDRNAVATPVWFSVCTRTSSAVARASRLAYRQGRWQPLTPPSASRRCADSSPVIHAL